MQSGGSYQANVPAVVTDMFGAIFGSIAANQNVRDLSINYDDVVIESTHVDSQQLMIGVVTVALFIYAIYLLFR